ncbi:MAG TPA: BamA/TamA family outer membrane protein [Longimicrobiaceae bacterium]|nr:BamA/TamA family outer membrane protein [Longimicrobiaceae bacterium]
MLFSLAGALLLGFQTTAADTLTPPAPLDATTLSSAYLDPGARQLVERARERRDFVDRSIQEYQVLAKERVEAGVRVLRRERQLFIQETAARIHWRRDGQGTVELLGAREATPMFTAGVSVPDNLRRHAVHLAYDPSRADLVKMTFQDEDSSIRHPLGDGSEAHYQFRSGETTTVRLADGRMLRLLELQLIPRRREFYLASGSLWLDEDTHAVVRAVVRPARPWDIALDTDEGDEVPGFVKPIRGEVRYITLEYGLWNMRWWLPRLIAFEGTAEVGVLGGAGALLRYERTYSDYRVAGDEAAGAVAAAAEAVLERCPDREERRGTGLSCRCEGGRCRLFDVQVPADTASLLSSPELPPSIFAEGPVLISDAEMREITEMLKKMQPPVWRLQPPTVDWSVARLDLLRYNRVEGLSVGARADVDFGTLTADGTLRMGVADLEPNAELGVVRETIGARYRIAGYRRLVTMDPASRALGLGNSLSALLFGRDDADYFRTLGIELIGSPPRTQPQGYGWRLFAEQQREAVKETDLSLPRLWDREHYFQPNVPADRANQIGAALALRTVRGRDPAGVRWGAELGVEGSTGTFDFARPSLTLNSAFPLSRRYMSAFEVAGGTSFGELPVQSLWYLGGSATVRGYGSNAARGEAFWRARAEVANALPGARLVLFSDAGWAGLRNDVQLDPTLLSAGVGASFLDGLIRVDLARALRGDAGWRMELYFGAGL